MELDHTLTSRDVINAKIRVILDEATDAWGIKVNRVELKNILPPPEIQDAMEKQMKAERQRREAILRAEGEKASKILVAEGQKESQILAAEGDKQAAILHAEAVKEAKIREAEGEAQAIVAVQEAQAKAIALINEAAPQNGYLTIKSLEAFEKAADGKATKLIVPSELQSLAGLAASRKGDFLPRRGRAEIRYKLRSRESQTALCILFLRAEKPWRIICAPKPADCEKICTLLIKKY